MNFAFPRALGLLPAIIVVGCASGGSGYDPSAAAAHPANPNAPAAPARQGFTLLKLSDEPLRPPTSTSPASQPAGAFICPMHPEVASATPSTCPKCKMKLERKADTAATTVPAKPAAPAPAARHDAHDHGGPR